jgi:GAF domain-containing protein
MLPLDGEPTRFRPGKGLAGWVYEHRQALLIEDVTKDSRWVKSKRGGDRTRSLIIAPLIVDLDNYGVMTISDERAGFFTEEHLRLVDTAAGQVARAISNAQLYSYVSQTAQELGESLRREQDESSTAPPSTSWARAGGQCWARTCATSLPFLSEASARRC